MVKYFPSQPHTQQTMSRFLLTGPEKIGKSVAANRIANALGCAHIKHEWDGIEALPESVLAVTTYTNLDPDDMEQHLKTMAVFIVDTSEALQALVEALEYKPIHSDEADVIGHQHGEGRHIGRLGALICKFNNAIFNVGTGFTDALREAPPPVGSRVTFTFQGVTDGGLPRFPVFLSERNYE